MKSNIEKKEIHFEITSISEETTEKFMKNFQDIF